MAVPPSAGNPVNVGPFQRIVGVNWPGGGSVPVFETFYAFEVGIAIGDDGSNQGVAASTSGNFYQVTFRDGSFYSEALLVPAASMTAYPSPVWTPLIADDDPDWRLIGDPAFPLYGNYSYSGLGITLQTFRSNLHTGAVEEYTAVNVDFSTARWGPYTPIVFRQISVITTPYYVEAWRLQVTPSVFS